MKQVIEVKGLKKSYGQLTAVNGVDLSVQEGEIFALLGPNGAGKSTLFDLITGYTKANAGKVKFFDKFKIFLLSLLTKIESIKLHFLANIPVISSRLLFLIFFRFLSLMPLLPPLAGIRHIIFFHHLSLRLYQVPLFHHLD